MPSRKERQELIERLETARGGRLCITYITSTRPGLEIQIGDDVLRRLYDHLESGVNRAKKGVDLFLHSNGGSATVPWRIVSLIREYTNNFALLVPYHAFSAGTLIALGADEIVMHKMGCLGPIDPSVANIFNPPHPYNPNQPALISVEDVSAYFKMIEQDVGIKHEDELIQAVTALTSKVHPLALGNVQRQHQQSRMIATKLLRKHLPAERHHEIEELIDHLKSNLYFHGHPINREEARTDLRLKQVVNPSPDLESLMWNLYVEYESALQMNTPFSPLREIESRTTPAAPPTPSVQQIVQQMAELAKNGVGIGTVTPQQMVELAVAIISLSAPTGTGTGKVMLDGIAGAYVESIGRTDVFKTDMSLERLGDVVKQHVRWQRWESET